MQGGDNPMVPWNGPDLNSLSPCMVREYLFLLYPEIKKSELRAWELIASENKCILLSINEIIYFMLASPSLNKNVFPLWVLLWQSNHGIPSIVDNLQKYWEDILTEVSNLSLSYIFCQLSTPKPTSNILSWVFKSYFSYLLFWHYNNIDMYHL